MKRLQGLLRDTWWLWLALLTLGTVLSVTLSLVFLVTFPISLFAFVYFGLVRYGDDGRPREM